MSRLRLGAALLIVLFLMTDGIAAYAGPDHGRRGGSSRSPGQAQPSPTPSASPTATASPTPSGSPTASPTASPSPTATPSPSPEPVPGIVEVSARVRETLVQMGGLVHYTVLVSNPGDRALEDVVVVDLVPREVDVVGVPLSDGVEAVQFGRHRQDEDIVWVLAPLEPGATVELPWTGRVTALGDLAAVNSVEVTVPKAPTATDEVRSYVAGARGGRPSNPEFTKTKREVVTVAVPRSTVQGAAAPLPVTGADSDRLVLAGGLLILIGWGLLGAMRRRRTIVVLIVIALTMSACTSDQPQSEDDAEVRGRRIEREDVETQEPAERDGEEAPEGAEGEPTGEPTDEEDQDAPEAAPAPAPVVPEVEFVQRVEVVEITASDLPVRTLGPVEGTNTLTYVWNDEEGEIEQAGSSLRVTPGAAAEVQSSLAVGDIAPDGNVQVTLTLTNQSPDERIAVEGRLVQEVFDSSGLVARLESERFDIILNPSGSLSADFFYRLPSGDYQVDASFEPE